MVYLFHKVQKLFLLILLLGVGHSAFANHFSQSNHRRVFRANVYFGWYNFGLLNGGFQLPAYGFNSYGYSYGYHPNLYRPFSGYYPSRIPNRFAALAYSPKKNVFGWSWGKLQRQDAVDSAKGYCKADDCAPLVWIKNGCAAAAALDDGTHLGWAFHPLKYVASTYALRSCKNAVRVGKTTQADQAADGDQAVDGDEVNQKCKIRAWVCSG